MSSTSAPRTPPVPAALAATGWALGLCVVTVLAYFGLGRVIVAAVASAILGMVILGAALFTVVAGLRRWQPAWLAYRPRPRPLVQTPGYWRTIAGGGLLAFAAGESLALWLYVTFGSPAFDQTISVRHHAGPVLTSLLVLLVAPLSEEAIFRGWLYPMLRRRVPVLAAITVTAVVFGLMHGNIVQFASALPLAVLLALVYERTRMLWPCVALHLGFNLLATLLPAQLVGGLANPVSAVLLLVAFAWLTGRLYAHLADPAPADAMGQESRVGT